MKTFQVKVIKASEDEVIQKVLENLERKGIIRFQEEGQEEGTETTTPASEEQVQEMIDEAELGPYYSEKEAKKILNL